MEKKPTAKTLKIVLIVIISYFLFDYLFKNHSREFWGWLNEMINEKTVSRIIAYIVFTIPMVLGVGIIHQFKNMCGVLGLNGSLPKGLAVSSLGTLPMLIGFAFMFKFNTEVSVHWIIYGSVVAAFFEELIFRGILFGQIFRYTKIGFIPAIFLVSVIFGAGHLYQSQDFSVIVGIFLTTFLGSVLFAWLFVEWSYNLWVAFSLHLFMNLYWILFSVSDHAFGSLSSNIYRIVSIVLTVAITIVYKKRKNLKFEVNRKTLLMKK